MKLRISVKRKIVLAMSFGFLFSSCGKDGKGCWQAFDPMGADARGLIVCDKTKAEAEAMHPQFWFYRSGEKKYCWRIEFSGNTYHTWGVPESMAQRYMQENAAYKYTRVDCNSFCVVEWHEKHKSKVTNQFGPVRTYVEKQLSADSCGKLFVGKVVILRETADSLITRELVKKFPD